MKKSLTLLIFIFLINVVQAQIFVKSSITNGSITIMPNGFQSKKSSPNLADTTNIAFGIGALLSNQGGLTGAVNNSAFGTGALYKNLQADANSAFGYHTLYQNSTGNLNVAFGAEALLNNVSGSYNSGFGTSSLSNNIIGVRNTSVGSEALYHSDGDDNIGIGYRALFNNLSGEKNIAVGNSALASNVTGIWNVAVGLESLNASTGSENVSIGMKAGFELLTGSNNIIIGSGANVPTNDADNQVRIGNIHIEYAGIQVPWTITSDERWKEKITTNTLGLQFIKDLKPVVYHRKSNKKNDLEMGLIAQDLSITLKKFNAENLGILNQDDKGFLSVRYNDLIAPLIKAIQELEEKNSKLEAFNAELFNRVKAIENLLKEDTKSIIKTK